MVGPVMAGAEADGGAGLRDAVSRAIHDSRLLSGFTLS
jgi:hypothetical protein